MTTPASTDGLVPPADAIRDPLWWARLGPGGLAGTQLPDEAFDFSAVAALGIGQLVSLTGRLHPNHEPLHGTAFDLQDLYGEPAPADPDREWERVTDAAAAVRAMIDAGEGVLVHCVGGTGRTGSVIGAVLVSFGHSADDVAAWLNDVHRRRGHNGWPECPWQRNTLSVLL